MLAAVAFSGGNLQRTAKFIIAFRHERPDDLGGGADGRAHGDLMKRQAEVQRSAIAPTLRGLICCGYPSGIGAGGWLVFRPRNWTRPSTTTALNSKPPRTHRWLGIVAAV